MTPDSRKSLLPLLSGISPAQRLQLSACAPPPLYEGVGHAGFSMTRQNGWWKTICWYESIEGVHTTTSPFEVSMLYDGEPAPISALISDWGLAVTGDRPASYRFSLEKPAVLVEVPGIEAGEILRVALCVAT